MFRSTPAFRVAHRLTQAVAVLVLSACAGATAPDEPGQQLYDVHVVFGEVAVIGSCDHNSIFEDREDGEFLYGVIVGNGAGSTTEFSKTAAETLTEGRHQLSGWSVVVRRSVTGTTGLGIRFTATERDGLLGNDPSMAYESRLVEHKWNGMTWDDTRAIALGNSQECSIQIAYSISSSRAP